MELKQLFQNALDKAERDKHISGRLGIVDPTTQMVTFDVPGKPGYVWLRPDYGGPPIAVFNDGAPLQYDLAVFAKRDTVTDKSGQTLRLTQVNPVLASVYAAGGQVPVSVPPTVHGADNGYPTWVNTQSILFDGLLIASGSGLQVIIKAFIGYYQGKEVFYPDTTVDLSGSLPSAGNHYWAIVGIDPTTDTFFISTTTPTALATPLTRAMIEAIDLTGKFVSGATQLKDTSTGLAFPGDFQDLRNWLGAIPGAAGFYQTVQGNGTPFPQEPILDFIDGTNTTVTVTDDPGGTRTKVAINGKAGDVVGPASAVANDFVQFNGTSGKLIEDGGLSLTTDGTLVGNSDSLVPSEQAVKTYVDNSIQGLSPKPSVYVWSNAALPTVTYSNGASGVGATLTALATGVLTVDGVAIPAGVYLGIKDQVSQLENGFYLVTVAGAIGVAFVLTRATFADTSAELIGAYSFTKQGTVNHDTGWICSNTTAITIGTTAITFEEFATAGINQLTGDGTAGPGAGSQTFTLAAVNSNVGTFSRVKSVTVNAKGLITAITQGLIDLATEVTGLLGLANGGTNADLSGSGSTTAFLAQNASHVVSARSIVDGDLPTALAGHTITGGSINNTPIGATTANTGIFSALSLLIGGFKAIFTHANSADRTYTFPNNSGTVALTSDIPAAGITQLTGDVTAGPGSGSQVATLKNTGTAGTYTKTTFDAQGRETSGTTLSSGDIPNLPASIITSGQLAVARGGSGADMSGAGAGFVKQATSGANFSIESQVSLATDVTGILPEANGGTNRSTGAATKALDNLASTAVNADVVPSADVTESLGSQTKRWLDIWTQYTLQDTEAFPVLNDPGGGTVASGAPGYLVYDATYGWLFKTTTTANLDGVKWAVCVVGGAVNTTIYVVTTGKVAVTLTANSAIGNFITTSTTAGRAAVSTTMRPEIFGVCLTANAGGAGGSCVVQLLCNTQFFAASNANRIYFNSAQSTTDFVSTINTASGSLTTTNVPYGTVTSGNANVLVPAAASQLGLLTLINTTRSNSVRYITAVNTGTKNITTVASTDSWANTDAITLRSQTVVVAAPPPYAMEIDLSGQTVIPLHARAFASILYTADTGSVGSNYSYLHPYATYAVAKEQILYNNSTAIGLFSFVTATQLYNQKFCYVAVASGAGTGSTSIQLQGYYLAVP